jgi:hypothetical protein
MNTKEIKRLAENHTYAELEAAIEQHLEQGTNSLYVEPDMEETLNVLSKASYIKQKIEKGEVKDIKEALRLLAGAIRQIQLD